MLSIFALALLLYFCVAVLLYVWGHPQLFLDAKSNHSIVNSTTHPISRQMAFGVQVANFALHGIPRRSAAPTALSVKEIYAAAIRRAFEKRHYFITTGSPHSRVLYLRNYAWFYPTLLDPSTFESRSDAERRITLMKRSLSIIFRSTKNIPYSTTLIPITPRRFVPINYIREPSDSLLGVLSALEQLTDAPLQGGNVYHDILERAAEEGHGLLRERQADLKFQLDHLIGSLRVVTRKDIAVPLIDSEGNRSSSTDTRLQKLRFVTNANVWATLRKAVKLGIAPVDEIETRIGRTLEEYKQEILALFGERGYIVDSLESVTDKDYANVSLDFCHVHRGFWTFSSEQEIELFRNTAEVFLQNSQLQDDSHRCFLVMASNPRIQFLKQIAVASYHGRTMWPAFNVEFADRLFDLSAATGNSRYLQAATEILKQIKIYIERIGYYPELLREDGRPYHTWIYRAACADTWFPRYAAVWANRLKTGLSEPAG
jgi:hypothetical protein